MEAPRWRPGSGVRNLGFVNVNASAPRPIRVDQVKASQMIDGLMAGMIPTFTRRAQYNDETVRVEVSSVNFSQFYEDYMACVASLLPMNFRQVERTAAFFRSMKARSPTSIGRHWIAWPFSLKRIPV